MSYFHDCERSAMQWKRAVHWYTSKLKDESMRIFNTVYFKVFYVAHLALENTFSRIAASLFLKLPRLSLPHSFPSLDYNHACAGPGFAARLPWRRVAVHKPGDVWGTLCREAGNLVHSLSLTPWMVLLQSSGWSRSHISKWKPYFFIRSFFHLFSQR